MAGSAPPVTESPTIFPGGGRRRWSSVCNVLLAGETRPLSIAEIDHYLSYARPISHMPGTLYQGENRSISRNVDPCHANLLFDFRATSVYEKELVRSMTSTARYLPFR
ncbi:uncharacterized protein LOC112494597 [Cephus cinctus]|uniref:Uncharacterized protein LOC112494597 n=1 Tax=Cephus cinctus TaxID=211228 RepID=A0AAJ7RKB8_CEPCN|nr:uncharacterized protein LOC112494597 [Cephus cinctus]